MNNEEKILNILSELSTTVNQIQRQINDNHTEVMLKLDALEKNQESIKDFIINPDNTFKKSEEAYQFVQHVKSYFNKQ
ncbi:hypothetical protein ACJDU8_17510 [Clostridium sp. WILCCON 0269]|uniref:DUF1657 domain-containing protein n=1 Tax=Candidatus Clostridium eludens TaxID=3381663 RepID=A0ABW8SNY0_9CLOT